jgi:hypothetical protein
MKMNKKTCPRCGKEKEEFAVAWDWKFCFNCSVELKSRKEPVTNERT